MSGKEVALIDLVRELGFDESAALSNWVRDIIKDKENFHKEFSIEPKKEGRLDGRPEKYMVKREAKTLVDNLCILKPYMSFFEKSNYDKTAFSPYRSLKQKTNRDLEGKAQALKKKLTNEKNQSEYALEQLSKVLTVFKNEETIDITSDSLRTLINNSASGEITDFSKSFKIAAWNNFANLKEKLKESGESSETYRKIGEAMFDLGDSTGAIEALNKATSLEFEDGTAWSLKAKIYLDLLSKSKKEQLEALALNDFSGYIAHPLNGEEHWINERIDDTCDRVEKLHCFFVESCFYALEYWPFNFYEFKNEKIKHFNHTSIKDIRRDWVFFHLTIRIRKDDFKEGIADKFIEIFKSFQMSSNVMPSWCFGVFSFEMNNRIPFELKLIEIFSWISIDICEQLLNVYIENFEKGYLSGELDIAILARSNIKNLFWNHLGQEKFLRTYSKLDTYTKKQRKIEKTNTLCSLHWHPILKDINEISGELKNRRYGKFCNKNVFSLQDLRDKWENTIELNYEKTQGWENLLNNSIWKSGYRVKPETWVLFFTCPLIEILNNKPTDIGVKTFLKFSKSTEALNAVVNYFSYEVLEKLAVSIAKNSPEQKYSWENDVYQILEEALKIKEKIDLDDMTFDESDTFPWRIQLASAIHF